MYLTKGIGNMAMHLSTLFLYCDRTHGVSLGYIDFGSSRSGRAPPAIEGRLALG